MKEDEEVKSLAREKLSKHGFMYKSLRVSKAWLELGNGKIEQGGEHSRKAHFLREERRLAWLA